MSIKDFIALIRDVGFPIVVASYLLIRLDSLLMALVKHEQREADTLDRIESYLLEREPRRVNANVASRL